MRNKTILSCLSVLVLAACGTSAEPSFYTLTPVPAPTTARLADVVTIGRPSVPGFLDRPDFVSQSGNQLVIDETSNWAQPLDEMVAATLAADVRLRLPHATVQTDADDAVRPPRFIVETNLQQFNRTDDGQLHLRGTFTLTDHNAQHQPTPQPINLAVDANSGAPATAQDLSSLLGLYADQIASALSAAPVHKP